MISQAVIFSLCLAVVMADPVKFKDCGSVEGKIDSIDITPCPNYPCMFPKGKNVSVSVNFKSGESVTSAKTVVHGIIASLPVPFPIPNADACSDMSCPIASGADVIYKNAIFVSTSYPKIRLVVKWEIQDQNGKDLVCFEVPAQIVD